MFCQALFGYNCVNFYCKGCNMSYPRIREDLAFASFNRMRSRKPLELDNLKRKTRRVTLDEEGDYVAPNRPKHVYKESKYRHDYGGPLPQLVIEKAARHGWYWDDLYSVACKQFTKPRHAGVRALFKRPSNSEYMQFNRTTNDWYATSDEAGHVVVKEKWNAKKIKNVSLPLHAAHDRVVAVRGDYELRSVRQKIDCGCVDYGYRDECAHGNKWPVKYVWFKVKREIRLYTGYVKRDGTKGYQDGYSSILTRRGYVVAQPMLTEISKHYATKKDIAKLAPVTQAEIRRFWWDGK